MGRGSKAPPPPSPFLAGSIEEEEEEDEDDLDGTPLTSRKNVLEKFRRCYWRSWHQARQLLRTHFAHWPAAHLWTETKGPMSRGPGGASVAGGKLSEASCQSLPSVHNGPSESFKDAGKSRSLSSHAGISATGQSSHVDIRGVSSCCNVGIVSNVSCSPSCVCRTGSIRRRSSSFRSFVDGAGRSSFRANRVASCSEDRSPARTTQRSSLAHSRHGLFERHREHGREGKQIHSRSESFSKSPRRQRISSAKDQPKVPTQKAQKGLGRWRGGVKIFPSTIFPMNRAQMELGSGLWTVISCHLISPL